MSKTFFIVFRSLFNYSWKTAAQTKKLEYFEVFCYFWLLFCPFCCKTSRDIEAYTHFVVKFDSSGALWFFFYFRITAEVFSIGLKVIKRVLLHFSSQKQMIRKKILVLKWLLRQITLCAHPHEIGHFLWKKQAFAYKHLSFVKWLYIYLDKTNFTLCRCAIYALNLR